MPSLGAATASRMPNMAAADRRGPSYGRGRILRTDGEKLAGVDFRVGGASLRRLPA